MIALLPAFLTKAYVRGHLRNLAGRMVQVHPNHRDMSLTHWRRLIK